MGKKALVIGIDEYPNAPLKGCVNDAEEISVLLKNNSDMSKNFDVRLETNVSSKEKLSTLIKTLFSTEEDVALLYFSGHGWAAQNDGEYICSPDYSPSFPGVKLVDILNWANNSKCKNKIIILDSCFSGGMGTSPFLGDNSILSTGLTIMTACRNYETSTEIKGHGVFTTLVIEALKGGAADLFGHITPGSIYAYIDKAMSSWEQRPVFKTNVHEFVSLRDVVSQIDVEDLRALPTLFRAEEDKFPLNPSYEFTNDPSVKHEFVKPYADRNNVSKLQLLQRLERVGLVKPCEEKFMYFATMHSKSCELTPLGKYYWMLASKDRF